MPQDGRTSRRTKATRSVPKSLPSYVITVAVGFFSFFAGTAWTIHSGIDRCIMSPAELFPGGSNCRVSEARIEAMVEERVKERLKQSDSCTETKGMGSSDQHDISHAASAPPKFPAATRRYAVGMSRIDKLDFAEHLDMGVPLDLPGDGDSEVIMIYGHKDALPTSYATQRDKISDDSTIPAFAMKDAVQHCDFVNIILTDRSSTRNQCVALVPQYESYHVQKWMRMSSERRAKVDPAESLRMVSRGMQANGVNQFVPPQEKHTKQNWDLLAQYFEAYKDALGEVQGILNEMKPKDNTVIVMVSNFGQSELLVNFVCAAQKRDLDTSQVLVFATDLETKALAESLGLRAYYDERNFGDMPSEAAGHYGDRRFTAMMMAKVICVQLVSALHYNLLFQDVDIVWYKHPLEYFQSPDKMGDSDFDVFFQDDGGHSTRYAPYSANSGFYYVKHNDRTQYFLTSLLLAGDLILKTDSHQQALIALLSEHVSLYGLKVKIMSRDTPEFPGGYHYHQASKRYMKSFFAKEVDPYIFHMSWTKNKDNKLLFFQQMGDWYVNEQCVHQKVDDVAIDDGGTFVSTCCSAEALIECHYRDKPSIVQCKSSPPIDKGHGSWW